MTNKRFALIGFMASGKSTVGAGVAACLGLPFIDLDSHIEVRTGTSIPDIFSTLGERIFRSMEMEALKDVSIAHEQLVLATGGGVVTEPSSRMVLKENFTSIYLRAKPDTIIERLRHDGGDRPLLQGDDWTHRVLQLMTARNALYDGVADVTIDVDGLSVDEVVTRVASRVE